MCRQSEDPAGQRWLDVGCGTGRLSRALARRGCTVLGFDASPEMIRVAMAESSAEQLATAPEFRLLPVDEIRTLGKFDGILCNSVLEYLEDPDACIAACVECLRPGGRLLVSVPNQNSFLRKTLLFTHSITRALTGRGWPGYISLSRNQYRPGDFIKLLQQHGLKIERYFYLGGPFPTWIQDIRFVGSLFMCVARLPDAKTSPEPGEFTTAGHQ